MRDEAHVRLVDAHAERDRRDHHQAFLALKARLVLGAGGRVHAGVIGQRAHALPASQAAVSSTLRRDRQ